MLWPLLQAMNQLRTAGAKRARNAGRVSRPDNASRVARPDNANRGPNRPSNAGRRIFIKSMTTALYNCWVGNVCEERLS